MLKAIDIAKVFVSWSADRGIQLTNLRIQKLLYYAQAWHLVNCRARLFSDTIWAVDTGVLVLSVYNKWLCYGTDALPCPSRRKVAFITKKIRPYQLRFLSEFFEKYGPMSATALRAMICTEQPWIEAHELYKTNEILPSKIREFYTEMYNKEMERE